MAEEKDRLDTKPEGDKPNTSTTASTTSAATRNSKNDKTEAEKQYEKNQADKADYASANEYKGDTFLNVKLALVDEDKHARTTFNNERTIKITCFFIPKFNKGAEFYNKEHAIFLPYSDKIHEIVLEDTLYNIGLKGYVELYDIGSALEGVFERHNNFYFVITFTEYVLGEASLKYEPYIFDVSKVETITKGYKSDKIVRIHLVDVITSILQSHSIASFIKFEGTGVTKNTKSYKELFGKIINYVKRFIKINTDNYFEFKKDVLYDEHTRFDGLQKMNGYDGDIDLHHLITASFNKIDRNASIWEAMEVLLRDCVTSIKMTQEMKDRFETIGDVLIPFFFKEEYSDIKAVYYNLWNRGNEIDISLYEEEQGKGKPATSTPKPTTTTPTPPTTDQPQTVDDAPTQSTSKPQGGASDNKDTLETSGSQPQAGTQQQAGAQSSAAASPSGKPSETPNSENKYEMKEVCLPTYGGNSQSLILRNITMRDFFMPFYLCFSYNKNGGPYVYEDINKGKIPISTMNGQITDNLQSLTFHSIEKSIVDKCWKNAIFLSANGSGTDCTMVFFDWFYKFFLAAFLNSTKVGGSSLYISNVIPDFYLFSLTHGVGYAKNAKDKTFDNMFDEYNAYTVVLDTKDTANEALREMGKNLTNLVLTNDSYKFSLKGNLLRRPNEIMRLNVGEIFEGDGADSQLPIFTNLSSDASLYVYVRQVTHHFKGETYTNNIIASKICESCEEETANNNKKNNKE